MVDLSSASAARNTARMVDEVHRTSKRGHPPRLDPPDSSRGSMAYSSGVDEQDQYNSSTLGATSARVVDVAPSVSPVDHITDKSARDMIHTLLNDRQFMSRLHTNTTTDERRSLRIALAPQCGGGLRYIHANPQMSVLIATISGMVTMLLISGSQKSTYNSDRFRGVASTYRDTINKILGL
jgi:hypothetical protein